MHGAETISPPCRTARTIRHSALRLGGALALVAAQSTAQTVDLKQASRDNLLPGALAVTVNPQTPGGDISANVSLRVDDFFDVLDRAATARGNLGSAGTDVYWLGDTHVVTAADDKIVLRATLRAEQWQTFDLGFMENRIQTGDEIREVDFSVSPQWDAESSQFRFNVSDVSYSGDLPVEAYVARTIDSYLSQTPITLPEQWGVTQTVRPGDTPETAPISVVDPLGGTVKALTVHPSASGKDLSADFILQGPKEVLENFGGGVLR